MFAGFGDDCRNGGRQGDYLDVGHSLGEYLGHFCDDGYLDKAGAMASKQQKQTGKHKQAVTHVRCCDVYQTGQFYIDLDMPLQPGTYMRAKSCLSISRDAAVVS